jgi:hypothetical protein
MIIGFLLYRFYGNIYIVCKYMYIVPSFYRGYSYSQVRTEKNHNFNYFGKTPQIGGKLLKEGPKIYGLCIH